MATRLWFPASTAAEVTPVANGSWGYTSESLDRKLADVKGSSAITIGSQIGPWTAGQTARDRRYVSTPLQGDQAISGTVKMQLMTREYNNGDNSTSRLEIYVVAGDGQSVRGTCLAIGQYGPTTEYVNNVTHRDKTFADGDTITTVNALDGDRIVVVVGHSDASGTTPEASCKFGENATDLPENETQTSDGAGWIEFSATLVFEVPPQTISGAGAIASAEAFGTLTINLSVSAAGAISSGSAFGTARLDLAVTGAGGIAGAEAFGVAQVNLGISIAGGIGTAEAFGTPTVSTSAQTISGAGAIASAEAFGVATLNLSITQAGAIAGAEAFGAAKLSLSIAGAGAIASAEAVGSPKLDLTLSGAGAIASTQAFGAASLGLAVSGAGAIPSGEAFGTPTIPGPSQTVSGAGAIASAEAFGTLRINLSVSAAGAIASAQAFGTPTLSKWKEAGIPFLFTASHWFNVSFYFEVYMRAVSGTARSRLWDRTAQAVLPGSELSTTGAALMRLRSGSLTFMNGREYIAQFGSSDPDGWAVKGAKVIAART